MCLLKLHQGQSQRPTQSLVIIVPRVSPSSVMKSKAATWLNLLKHCQISMPVQFKPKKKKISICQWINLVLESHFLATTSQISGKDTKIMEYKGHNK